MKLKYFLRGFGAGIVFASLILIAAYMTSPNKVLTDEEIMSRAMELGMVKEDTKLDQLLDEEKNSTDDTSSEAASVADGDTSEASEGTSEDTTEEQISEDTTEEDTTEEETTEDTTEEQTSEETTEETTEEEVITANIVVRAGMQSIRVARLLEEHKIIENADDFDAYLVRNGYSTKIRVGTFTVKSSYSYEQLAKILTGRQ